jgi:hypothetical protein
MPPGTSLAETVDAPKYEGDIEFAPGQASREKVRSR